MTLTKEKKVLQSVLGEAVAYIDRNRAEAKATHKTSVSNEREVVTNIDIALNKIIAQRLVAAFPRDAVVGEESSLGRPADGGRFWLVDPIDGTRSFVDARYGCSIMIALVEEGTPQLSLIHDIARRTTWIATPSSFQMIVDGTTTAVRRRSKRARKIIWNPYSKAELRDDLVHRLEMEGVIETESTGLRAIAMAMGEGAMFASLPGSSKIWDSGPAAVLLRWAGATYTDLDGQPLRYLPDEPANERGAIATLGIDHDKALEAVKIAAKV